jgi:hypothetical protein
MPSQAAPGCSISVTTRPGASGVPRWSCEPCQKRRAQPCTRAGRRSKKAKSAFQMSEP